MQIYSFAMKKILSFLCICFCVVNIVGAAISSGQKAKVADARHIPILAWTSIPPGEYATLEHYQELRDAGFDYSLSWTGSLEEAIHTMDLAAKVGIKMVFMCPELSADPEKTVGKVKDHPGLGMYYLRDEPGNDALEALGTLARRIEHADTTHPCYMNLLPSYCFTPDGYAQHLRLFTETVGLPQISFDNYPILESDGRVYLCPTWYQNLEMVSAEARRVGVPFWAFALTTAHTNWGLEKYYASTPTYPVPTIEYLRIQVYSNLAYGAQLLQYFTYWNPTPGEMNFHQAPVLQDGRRSSTYELVRQMNHEIQRRAFVWAGCQVEHVHHLGDSLPVGTSAMVQLPAHFRVLESVKGRGLVSEITNDGRRFVMLENTSPTEPWHVDVTTDDRVALIRQDASSVPASHYGPLFILSPGNCEIFEVK